jgi:hypothetical protein
MFRNRLHVAALAPTVFMTSAGALAGQETTAPPPLPSAPFESLADEP